MKIIQEQLDQLIENETFFARGREYFNLGLIDLVSVGKHEVQAESVGSLGFYEIHLNLDSREKILNGRCSCPAFEKYGPCKHMAAVGLVLIAQNHGVYEPSIEFLEFKRKTQNQSNISGEINQPDNFFDFITERIDTLEPSKAKAYQSKKYRSGYGEYYDNYEEDDYDDIPS